MWSVLHCHSSDLIRSGRGESKEKQGTPIMPKKYPYCPDNKLHYWFLCIFPFSSEPFYKTVSLLMLILAFYDALMIWGKHVYVNMELYIIISMCIICKRHGIIGIDMVCGSIMLALVSI